MGVITRLITWNSGDVLTASALNGEFNNILTDYNGNINNNNLSPTAAIAYSKLALTGGIVNADISASAAIDPSKINGTIITETGVATLSNKTLTKPVVNASVPTLVTATYGNPTTFNCGISNHHRVVLTGSGAVMLATNVSAGQTFIVHLEQDAFGNRTVVWWADIKWAGGTPPTLTTTANKIDTFGFIFDGTYYYGYVIGQNI